MSVDYSRYNFFLIEHSTNRRAYLKSFLFNCGFVYGTNMINSTDGKIDAIHKMAACTRRLEPNSLLTYTQCRDAVLKSEHKSDILIFIANLTLDVLRSILEYIIEYSVLIFLSVIISVLMYLMYKSYWNPVVYTKELSQVGFDHITPGKDRDLRIARALVARRVSNKIPPPFPNGWFVVAESRDLKIGGVVAVDALGQNLCVYRGDDGIARCVDAYCPHLGANLAIGGNVCGNCIECPFHKWRFDAEGVCVSVPGGEHAPKGVSIKTWNTVEADGAVWIWYDAEGRDPLWELTDAPEVKTWAYRGKNEFYVSAHIQEIPENGADVAHLNAVHATSMLTNLGDKYPILGNIIGRHVWNATWTRGDDHRAYMTLKQDYNILKFDLFHFELQVIQIGPAHVRLLMFTPVGPFFFTQSITPIGPLLQKVVHRLYSPVYNAPFASLLIVAESLMIERDIQVWNSKCYISGPSYVKTDKTIRSFRSWYSQFYSERSRSFRDASQNPLDW